MRHPVWSTAPLAVLAAGCACLSTDIVARTDFREPVAGVRAGHPSVAVATAGPLFTTGPLFAAGGGAPRTGYLGVGVQGLFPSSASLSTGIGLDVNYTANLAERFSVELSLGRVGYDVSPGDFDAVTLGAVAQFGMPFGAARWYAGGGLAYWMNDLSGIAIEADDSVALIIAGGADLPIAAAGNLCIELRYVLAEADLSGGGSLDLDAFGVRLNYVFKY